MIEELIKQAQELLDQIKIAYREEKRNGIEEKKKILFNYSKENSTIFYMDKEIKLTRNESIIIEELINAENHFCTYKELARKIYDYEYDENIARSLKVGICRLRKKVESIVKIKTNYSRGIYIEEPKTKNRK